MGFLSARAYVLLCVITSACLSVVAQKSREANRDLQIQLDQVLQQAQDPNSKGNSLFAEVNETSIAIENSIKNQTALHTS